MELARFAQFVKTTLFGSPCLLVKILIRSSFHSEWGSHLVPIFTNLGSHWKIGVSNGNCFASCLPSNLPHLCWLKKVGWRAEECWYWWIATIRSRFFSAGPSYNSMVPYFAWSDLLSCDQALKAHFERWKRGLVTFRHIASISSGACLAIAKRALLYTSTSS